jgi:hypothetical protein
MCLLRPFSPKIQYHPEKILYEWWSEEVINHSTDSVHAMEYLSELFVSYTRQNSCKFLTPAAEYSALIYNYPVTYTGAGSFVETYYF